MKFTRRTFLRGASLSLASASAFCHDVIINKNLLIEYSQTFAQSTPRKLALLIGINKYPQGNQLRGCVTDVELQKELLVNRFRFSPDDIVTLTDKQATKQQILTSFDEHLVKQVQSNDVVVIHFSGYGRQVQLTEANANLQESASQCADSLILYDTIAKSKNEQTVNDLLLDTLMNLCGKLKTNKYTLILDTSYTSFSQPIPNQLWLRSYSSHDQELAKISSEELKLNQQFKNPLQKLPIYKNKYNKVGGVIITTSPEDLATEITSNNFNAGLLTYNLTQSLWQSFPETKNLTVLKDINSQMGLYSFDGDKIRIFPENKMELSPYYLPLTNQTRGEAIISKFTSPNNVELELLGLPLFVLANYNQSSTLSGKLDTGETIIVQINSLTGNKAKGVITNLPANTDNLQGLILHEYWRIISRHKGLTVALDNSLAKIEKVDATSALSSMANVESVINIGDNFADCILGKFKSNANDSQDDSSYGLFSISGELFPNTTAKTPHEAVTTAVKRLSSSLQHLLAEKLLHLTLNYQSSPLAINVNLKITNNNQTITTGKKTLNSQKNLGDDQQLATSIKQLSPSFLNIPFGSQLQLNIDNNNDLDLYCLVLAINSAKKILTYFSPDAFMLDAHKNLTIPSQSSSIQWIANSGKGLEELIIICATSPFNKTGKYLYQDTTMKPNKEQFISLENPQKFVTFILDDLHECKSDRKQKDNDEKEIVKNLNSSEVYALNLSNWASFNFVYEIV